MTVCVCMSVCVCVHACMQMCMTKCVCAFLCAWMVTGLFMCTIKGLQGSRKTGTASLASVIPIICCCVDCDVKPKVDKKSLFCLVKAAG